MHRFFLSIIFIALFSFSAQADLKYKTTKSDIEVSGRQVYKDFLGKSLRAGVHVRGVTLGKGKRLYDSFGKLRPNREWFVTKNGVLVIKDKGTNWGVSYKIVKNKSGKYFAAGTKKRYRIWLKPGKISN